MGVKKSFWLIKICFFVLALTQDNSVYSQQTYQSGLYMQDPYLINPAFAGIYNYMSLGVDLRRQWTKIPGAPESQFLTFNMPLYNLSGGIGLNINREVLGASRLFNGDVSYNYVIPNFFGSLLSIGGGIGVRSNQLDGSILRTPGGEYLGNISNHNDPRLIESNMSTNNLVFQLGMMARMGQLELGISTNQLFATTLSRNDVFSYKPKAHVNVYGSYFYGINEAWSLSPSFLLKTDLATIQSDFDVLLYNRTLFGGLGLRGYSNTSIDGMKFILGGKVTPNLMVSYNYELILSQLKITDNNTHELLILLRIPTDKFKRMPIPIIFHPRM